MVGVIQSSNTVSAVIDGTVVIDGIQANIENFAKKEKPCSSKTKSSSKKSSKSKTDKKKVKSSSKKKKETEKKATQPVVEPESAPEPESEDTRKEEQSKLQQKQTQENTAPVGTQLSPPLKRAKLSSIKKKKKKSTTPVEDAVTAVREPGQDEKQFQISETNVHNNNNNNSVNMAQHSVSVSKSNTISMSPRESSKRHRKSPSKTERRNKTSEKTKKSPKITCTSELAPVKRHKRRHSSSKSRHMSKDIEDGYCGQFFEEENEDTDFVCLTEADIIAQQNKEIEEVAEVLSVSLAASIALCKHFKWNRDKLMTSYFDNPDAALEKAGVSREVLIRVTREVSTEQGAKELLHFNDGEEVECSICSCDVEADDMFALQPCGHYFCKGCWARYLTLQIVEGETFINCPHLQCPSLVQESTVKELVDSETYRKYCTFFMKSFVDDNDNVKWCPAPGCGNAVTAEMISGQTVTCGCGYRFCFRCSEEAHQPATCEQLKMWKKKCQDESETNNWIAANTQDCPKCSLPTEKNGGCNHMTCRQCKYEYCWICNKEWKGHNDYYSCNRALKSKVEKRFAKKSSRKEREQQRIEMRSALDKYLDYYSRYMNHTRSSELERIREKAISKMQEMQETEATSAEVLFIKRANDQLVECRSVLKYSYVLHYYMEESDPKQSLLKYLQEDLEKTVEHLSEIFENPMNHKIEIVNLTRLAETRLHNLLDAAST